MSIIVGWTSAHDDELRLLMTGGLCDDDILREMKITLPRLTRAYLTRRRLALGIKRPRGGSHPFIRPEGDQHRCLGCTKPFRTREKFKRLCDSCARKNQRICA